MGRLPAIDGLRFLFAFWVVLHHAGPPPSLPTHLDLAWRSLWFGPAAVLGFFVISGFCIHSPYLDRAPNWRSYFARRYIRIGIPFAAIFAVGAIAHVDYNPLHGAVTWSLVSELVYYTAYPATRAGIAKLGYLRLLAITLPLGYLTVACVQMGHGGEWYVMLRSIILYYPVWLLGCWIADAGVKPAPLLVRWLGRLAALAAVALIGWLHYRNIVSAYWTMPIAAILAAPWLRAEFAQFTHGPQVWAGQWSYSLYLVHVAALAWVSIHLQIAWGYQVALALIAGYGYFLLIEAPAHRLARLAGSRLRVRAAIVPSYTR